MQQKADLSQMQELASRMKRIDSNLENQIMGMHKQTNRMIRETNSQYNESYVRSATQEVEETLNRIYSLAESISKKLRRRSDSLVWSANLYKHTEDQACPQMKLRNYRHSYKR